MGSAQSMRASGTQTKEKVGSVCIIQLKRSALLQAAVAMLKLADFVGSMVQMDSALPKGVMLARRVVVFARNMELPQSALGNGAPRPLLQGEGVSSTAVAKQKSAR